MKLFKQMLVAPAALGLLSPISASASEVNFDAISSYSKNVVEVDSNSFKPLSSKETLLSGGEGLVDSHDHDGSFSETTTASFGVDFLLSAVDEGKTYDANGAAVSGNFEKLGFDYQMGIGLETSFTGEDSLSATIDIGNGSTAGASADGLNFDSTSDALTLD